MSGKLFKALADALIRCDPAVPSRAVLTADDIALVLRETCPTFDPIKWNNYLDGKWHG